MITLQLPDFSIEQIANSGQCFRINKRDEKWEAIAWGKLLYIQQIDKLTHIFHCSEEEYMNIWMDYFDLKTDYGIIKRKILKTGDDYLIKASEYGYGIRILKQDLWEMIVSYILSQRNNIPRIKKAITMLCEPYGYKFPTINDLKNYKLQDFIKIGAGYRSQYLIDICDINLEYLRSLEYNEALLYLKQFNGIGDKVANCIALFGLYHIDAFPRDVWINRTISERYNNNFDIAKFEGYAGIVQQYMFFYERSLPGKSHI